MVPRTSARLPSPPECHPGDGPGMKPIFDGVYINQILLQAQVPSASAATPRCRPRIVFLPSRTRVRVPSRSLTSLIDRRSFVPQQPGPLAEWPFKTELKRGSIFIRRFLMKHFKCMELAVALTPWHRRVTHVAHAPRPTRNLHRPPCRSPMSPASPCPVTPPRHGVISRTFDIKKL